MRVRRLAPAMGALIALLVAACGGGGGGASNTSGVVLGSSLSMSGSLGSFGVLQQKGYQQAVDDLNAAGGINVGGSKLKVSLNVLDNRSDPSLASQQSRQLALKNNATALLGASTPPVNIPEALVADQQKVPFVTTNTPVLAFQSGNQSGWKYAWDLFFSEHDQASSAFQAFDLGPTNKKVALFTDTEPDGVVERGLYKQAGAAKGYDIVGDYSFPVGTTDYSVFINDAKAKGADVVLVQMVPPDGIALWKQMRALGYAPKMALAAKAGVTDAWWQALGPIAEGSLSEGFWTPSDGRPGTDHMTSTLGRKLSLTDLQFAVGAYTVVQVVADAITKAGSTDPAKINSALAQTNKAYTFADVKFNSAHISVTPHGVVQWVQGKTVKLVPRTGQNPEYPAGGLKA
jgi:branched-chain amino acid transport system substrate-binding protein